MTDNESKGVDLFNKCSELMMNIYKCEVPTIRAVNEVATAAGLQLVSSCDLVVGHKDSKYSTPGVNIGLFCSTPSVALSRVDRTTAFGR